MKTLTEKYGLNKEQSEFDEQALKIFTAFCYGNSDWMFVETKKLFEILKKKYPKRTAEIAQKAVADIAAASERAK